MARFLKVVHRPRQVQRHTFALAIEFSQRAAATRPASGAGSFEQPRRARGFGGHAQAQDELPSQEEAAHAIASVTCARKQTLPALLDECRQAGTTGLQPEIAGEPETLARRERIQRHQAALLL